MTIKTLNEQKAKILINNIELYNKCIKCEMVMENNKFFSIKISTWIRQRLYSTAYHPIRSLRSKDPEPKVKGNYIKLDIRWQSLQFFHEQPNSDRQFDSRVTRHHQPPVSHLADSLHTFTALHALFVCHSTVFSTLRMNNFPFFHLTQESFM